ncbi:hypothetical protein EJ02DRAFT_393473 [Clathrospora elynae]|uniref:Uncharacterized protein n=1 Tax=Clathrospora elynae TaxID=706981 RepID=A0A6A5T3V5_9PLEO|nr:hypothetical protein EJ02DRAFT_393473 [Clathrospora elynae]
MVTASRHGRQATASTGCATSSHTISPTTRTLMVTAPVANTSTILWGNWCRIFAS